MKSTTIVILALLSILLVACGPSTPSGPVFDPYVGGSTGLRVDFVEGMPPMEDGAILDAGKSQFSIGLKLTNEGEYDIEADDIRVELRGLLPAQFDLADSDLVQILDEPLQGAKKNIDGTVLPGQFTTLVFPSMSYLPDSQGDIPKNFLIDVCYNYETKSTTPVCIADDVAGAITNTDDKEICQVNGQKETKNSGGPVQITEFKQLPQGGAKTSIIFVVSHVGTGKIFKTGTTSTDCSDSLSNPDRNKIELELSLPEQSTGTILCSGGDFSGSGTDVVGEVTLFEGNPRTITCSIEGKQGRDLVYEDLLRVDMRYRYKQQIGTTINIKDLGTINDG